MKNEKLLKTIGEISDELIEEATIQKLHAFPKNKNNEKRNMVPAIRRVYRFGVAIALIACLMGTVVFAARSWRFNGYNAQVDDSWDVVSATDDNGNSNQGSLYELSFFLPLNENAPNLIETFYFPQVPVTYKHSFGMAYAGLNYDKLASIVYAWDIPDGAKQGIMFHQESGFESNKIVFYANGTSNSEPMMKEAELGGVEGLLIVEPIDIEFPQKYFFWSNGEYVFHIRFPVEFSEEQMAEIVGSVDEVEDVRQYLISMTEEQMKKTFDQSS